MTIKLIFSIKNELINQKGAIRVAKIKKEQDSAGSPESKTESATNEAKPRKRTKKYYETSGTKRFRINASAELQKMIKILQIEMELPEDQIITEAIEYFYREKMIKAVQ